MRYPMLLPLVFLGLAGCVVSGPAPTPASSTTTYVTPAPAATMYVSPAAPTTTTVIRTP